MIRFGTILLSALALAATGASQVERVERSSSSTSSATRRVVVVNGEKIVDEATKDGVKVTPSAVPVGGDAETTLKQLMEEMLRDLPPEARRLLEDAGRKGGVATARSSHSHRVVVRNGEVVVDEETRDGVPVPRVPVRPSGPGASEARASAGSSATGRATGEESAARPRHPGARSADRATGRERPAAPEKQPAPESTGSPRVRELRPVGTRSR
jgi:hypothetical protein